MGGGLFSWIEARRKSPLPLAEAQIQLLLTLIVTGSRMSFLRQAPRDVTGNIRQLASIIEVLTQIR